MSLQMWDKIWMIKVKVLYYYKKIMSYTTKNTLLPVTSCHV